jgi:uncharacterized membrane protein (UPF0127 family)
MKRIWIFRPQAACAALFTAAGLVTGCGPGAGAPAAPTAGTTNGSEPAPATQSQDPRIPTKAQPRLQTLKLWIGTEQLTTELALTPIQEQTGMMFRTNMAETEGMLFVFATPERASFWMMNTILPLSAAYIGPDGNILEIHDLQPHDTNAVVAATDNIQFVLETTQGWFKRHNIGVGTAISTEKGSLTKTFGLQ